MACQDCREDDLGGGLELTRRKYKVDEATCAVCAMMERERATTRLSAIAVE